MDSRSYSSFDRESWSRLRSSVPLLLGEEELAALRGANELMAHCKKKLGPKDHLSADGKFYWQEVECLGACSNAPMAAINDYYYEDLTVETLDEVLNEFAAPA